MLIDLQTWIDRTYGANPPVLRTVRRWCRQGKIFPPPQKHGRNYYVEENARYCTNPVLRRVYAKIRAEENEERKTAKRR